MIEPPTEAPTEPPPEPTTAREWYDRGIELGGAGDFDGAAAAFLRSYELQPTSEALGDLFMTSFIAPFEIVSVLLLVALVGAAVIARRKGDTSEPD